MQPVVLAPFLASAAAEEEDEEDEEDEVAEDFGALARVGLKKIECG